jgi:hypothetical protein
MNPHLSQSELVEQLYGVGGKEAHVRECAECAGRLEALLQLKGRVRSDADTRSRVSGAFLASQRRAIYARLDSAAAAHVRWAPALAGAGLLAMGLFLIPHVQAPRTPAPTARVELNTNEQLFSDLYSMEQSVEPSAAAPIHELFEGTAGSEEQ